MSARAPHKVGAHTKSGSERDWCSRFRRYLKFGPGVAKWMKRQMHKRTRRMKIED